MRMILAASTAMFLLAAPAHAQVLGGLGGGGMGGMLGGTLGGTLAGAGSIGGPLDSVDTATSGTLRGSGSASTHKSVDRKSGKVHADGAGEETLAGHVAQTVAAPTHMTAVNGSAGGSGKASGSANAQLVGTDAVRSAATGTVGAARGAADSGAGAVNGLASSGRSIAASGAGSAAGSASGAGNAGLTGGMASLAAAGSMAAAANGAFAVAKGMPVLSPGGDRIGKVREVIADSRGNVRALLVKVDGEKALLPAANFSGSGNAVVSAMSEGAIKQTASQQAPANKAG